MNEIPISSPNQSQRYNRKSSQKKEKKKSFKKKIDKKSQPKMDKNQSSNLNRSSGSQFAQIFIYPDLKIISRTKKEFSEKFKQIPSKFVRWKEHMESIRDDLKIMKKLLGR